MGVMIDDLGPIRLRAVLYPLLTTFEWHLLAPRIFRPGLPILLIQLYFP